MTVETHRGVRTFYCDSCQEDEVFDAIEPFEECWEELKSQGWWCQRDVLGEWQHLCSQACQPDKPKDLVNDAPEFLKNLRRPK